MILSISKGNKPWCFNELNTETEVSEKTWKLCLCYSKPIRKKGMDLVSLSRVKMEPRLWETVGSFKDVVAMQKRSSVV